MTRFCANCGTEVDDHAVFCPTCGQPIDEETEAEMPPAPSWPEPAVRDPQPTHERADPDEPEPVQEPPPRDDRGWSPERDRDAAEMTRVVEPQPGPDVEPAPSPAPAKPPWRANFRQPASRAPTRPAVDLRLTMPVTLSGWLIGSGAVLGAIGAIIAMLDGLGTAIDLLLLVGLSAVAASVFLSDRLPHVPQLRLIVLSIVLVAFGVAIDRLGFGRAGVGDLLLFLGTAAASIGAIILEAGRDQPLGGPSA